MTFNSKKFFGLDVGSEKKVVKDLTLPVTVAGVGLGSSLLGGAMPGSAGTALTKTGSALGKTVPPLVALSVVKIGGGELMKSQKKLEANKFFGM